MCGRMPNITRTVILHRPKYKKKTEDLTIFLEIKVIIKLFSEYLSLHK